MAPTKIQRSCAAVPRPGSATAQIEVPSCTSAVVCCVAMLSRDRGGALRAAPAVALALGVALAPPAAAQVPQITVRRAHGSSFDATVVNLQ